MSIGTKFSHLLAIFLTVICFTQLRASTLFFQVLRPDSLRFTYEIHPARDFGKFVRYFDKIGVILADPPQACSQLSNFLETKGRIVLVERGECSFMTKAVIAEQAGASAILVTDSTSADEKFIEMVKDETGRVVSIGAAYLPGIHGKRLRNHLLYDDTPLLIRIPLNLTFTPLHAANKPPWELW